MQVLQREPHLVPTLLEGALHRERLVVGGRFSAPAEQIQAFLLRGGAELLGLGPGRRRGPAVLVEQALGVPHGVDGEHVVHRRELVAERSRCEHAAIERVPDRDALQVGRIDHIGQVLELAQDRVDRHRTRAGVVHQVGRIACDEPGLQLLGDLRGRGHLHCGAVMLLGKDLAGELHERHPVATIDDHRIDGHLRLHPERVVRIHLTGRLAVTGGLVRGAAAGGAGGEGDAQRKGGCRVQPAAKHRAAVHSGGQGIGHRPSHPL